MYSIKKKETNLKNLLKLAIVLTSVAALAGCGGDDHPTQSGTNPGDTNTAPGNGNTGTTPPADAQRVNLPLTNYVNVFVGTDVATTGGGFSGNTTPGA